MFLTSYHLFTTLITVVYGLPFTPTFTITALMYTQTQQSHPSSPALQASQSQGDLNGGYDDLTEVTATKLMMLAHLKITMYSLYLTNRGE
jgi:hypothetical protein